MLVHPMRMCSLKQSLASSLVEVCVASRLQIMPSEEALTVMGKKGWDTPNVRRAFTGAFNPRAPMAVGELPGQWKARVDADIEKRKERAEEDKIRYQNIELWARYRARDQMADMQALNVTVMKARLEVAKKKFGRQIKGLKTRTRNLRAKVAAKDTEIRKLKAKVRKLQRK